MIDNFKCIADKCKHSCCIGWEIDVDEETYSMYEEVVGEFGDRLLNNIVEENGTKHFILDENERCPFLNENNLCDIILNIGEDYLCDICREHPRFYIEDGEEYLCGYGMCCEEASRLIISDDSRKDEAIIGEFTKYIVLPDMKTSEDISKATSFLLGLEKLGTAWEAWLIELSKNSSDILKKYKSSNYNRKEYLNIFDYLMFRYRNSKYAGFMLEIIILISELLINEDSSDGKICTDMCNEHPIEIEHCKGLAEDTLIDICREYSSEIEYSEENVTKIMEWV